MQSIMNEAKKSFEEQLWDQLKDNWEYKEIPLFSGKPDAVTGKRSNLHVLEPKEWGMYFSCREIVED